MGEGEREREWGGWLKFLCHCSRGCRPVVVVVEEEEGEEELVLKLAFLSSSPKRRKCREREKETRAAFKKPFFLAWP